MTWIAWKMLTGNRGKYIAIILGIAFASLLIAQQSSIFCGLHVRVDIDEHDVHRFSPAAPAVATLRGRPDREIALKFVRVEPYVVPKRSLTGDNTARVDTRVLQVIYQIESQAERLYVGQQVDVSIGTEEAVLASR